MEIKCCCVTEIATAKNWIAEDKVCGRVWGHAARQLLVAVKSWWGFLLDGLCAIHPPKASSFTSCVKILSGAGWRLEQAEAAAGLFCCWLQDSH